MCVSECSCVRTVSDLLGEFSHFSAATWLSWAAFGLEQSRSDLHLQFAAYPHLSCLQITQSHLAEMLSEQNCSCRSKHLGITTSKVATFEGFLLTERRQPPGWVAFWSKNTFAGRFSEIVYVCWILDSHFWEPLSEQNALPTFFCKAAFYMWPAGTVGDLWGEFSHYSALQFPCLSVQIEPHTSDQRSGVDKCSDV